jgi:uncharacterized membrane protein
VDSRLPKLCFFLLALYAAVHFSDAYGKLPEIIASHFDGRGQANGWQPKSAFFLTILLVSVLVSIVGFAIPALISALPPELVNLPNKKYWLSEEHRSETMEFFKAHFAWFACALFTLLILIFDYALQFNLHPDHPPSPARMWYLLGGFLACTLALTIRLFAKFLRPPQDFRS